MLIFEQTDEFANWLKALKDIKAKARISARLRVAQNGNLGDCQPVGEGVSEMRIHWDRDTGSISQGRATSSICC